MHHIREIFSPVPKPPPIPPPVEPLDPRPTRAEREAEMLSAQNREYLYRQFERMKFGPRRPRPWGDE
jgi:hypothetical protein